MAMNQTQAEAFLFREVRLLDRRRFRDWRQLLTDDAIYWVPNGDPDGDPQRHCSIVYATPAMVDDRLERAESPFYWVGDPPIRSVHTVSNVLLEQADETQAELAGMRIGALGVGSEVETRAASSRARHHPHLRS